MKKIALGVLTAAALAGNAQAADLGVRRVAVPAAIAAPVFNWTGFYAGLNIGLGIANTNFGVVIPGAPSSGSGLVAGGQIGYNHQINNVVLGVEADLGYFGVSRTAAIVAVGGPTTIFTWKTTWDASLRARAGVAVDRALLYVTGGVAFADIGIRQTLLAVTATGGQTRVGWTLGAGLEYAVTQNWTIRGEYLYANYGRKGITANTGVTSPPVSLQEHKVRIGLNYLFSTGPSAVVARY
ncbi:porin family protein [Phreatobacter aquaticus]|uniref:Porin family protein n=1 Tax=Phreatobacter aquaticus TaxID=2570229 RepID=A0A4D7QLN4_9HYPH|nr:outer membrane protein [Phreatobacter aquaticus]QCK86264.1 porin family protein [Phreatobacter aquaticus]